MAPEARHDLSLGSGSPQMESGLIRSEYRGWIGTSSLIAQLECGVEHRFNVEDCRLKLSHPKKVEVFEQEKSTAGSLKAWAGWWFGDAMAGDISIRKGAWSRPRKNGVGLIIGALPLGALVGTGGTGGTGAPPPATDYCAADCES